ncbi:MAG: hypothetical protein ABIK76_02455, partial [candidate division WOR-3 bacterium]
SLILVKKEIWERIRDLIKEKKSAIQGNSLFGFNNKNIGISPIFDITGKKIDSKKINRGIYFIKNKNIYKLIKIY